MQGAADPQGSAVRAEGRQVVLIGAGQDGQGCQLHRVGCGNERCRAAGNGVIGACNLSGVVDAKSARCHEQNWSERLEANAIRPGDETGPPAVFLDADHRTTVVETCWSVGLHAVSGWVNDGLNMPFGSLSVPDEAGGQCGQQCQFGEIEWLLHVVSLVGVELAGLATLRVADLMFL